MRRLAGVLLAVLLLYAGVMLNPAAWKVNYQHHLAAGLGFYGLLAVGVGLLMLTGGIDLSVGAVVGLGAAAMGLLLERGFSPAAAVAAVVGGSLLIGLTHGLLATLLRLPSFLVTLGAAFTYEAFARWIASRTTLSPADDPASGLREVLLGESGRNQLLVLLSAALALGLILQAGRLVRRRPAEAVEAEKGGEKGWEKVLAHVVCSGLAGLAAVLFYLENGVGGAAATGPWLAVYAIAAAVLGGCSLRGGRGTVFGMVLGAALLPLLAALCALARLGGNGEHAVIGGVLLLGLAVDEAVARRAARAGQTLQPVSGQGG